MLNSITLKASTRDSLVKIAHAIANGIDESFLFRKGVPLVVLVTGDPDTGKKIMPDETIEFFKKHYRFSDGVGSVETEFFGNDQYDEYHALKVSDRSALGVSFINVSWDYGYSDIIEEDDFFDALEGMDENKARVKIAERFVDIHAEGNVIPACGIAFVHNLKSDDIASDLRLNFKYVSKQETELTIVVNDNSVLAKSSRFQTALTQMQRTFA